MSKTIVFCPTEDAADRMRVALNNLNTDMVLKDNQGKCKGTVCWPHYRKR